MCKIILVITFKFPPTVTVKIFGTKTLVRHWGWQAVNVSALCHVRTAPSVIDPSRLPVRAHGMSCRSVYVTLGYRWPPSMHTWKLTYSPLRLRPRCNC